MTKLFHSAPLKLAPGSVVLPGNWGRIIRAIGERHDRWHQEVVLEQVRAARYAHLPSRLDACFACANEEALRFYVRHANKDNPCPPVLYEVQKVEPEANEHRTDFNLISANKPGETIEENAERYWRGDFWYEIAEAPGMRCEEVVTTSPLRILQKLD